MLFDIDFDVATDSVKPVNTPMETWHQVQQFIFHEARLLDERRWQEWLDLWTDDGMYWIPQEHGQTSPYDHISLCWENKILREMRIRTLTNERNWAQQPVTHSSRVIGNVMIDGTDSEGYLVVRSAFHLTESRKDETRYVAGSYIHKLASTDGGWRIRLKQVNLVNCDGTHKSIQAHI